MFLKVYVLFIGFAPVCRLSLGSKTFSERASEQNKIERDWESPGRSSAFTSYKVFKILHFHFGVRDYEEHA